MGKYLVPCFGALVLATATLHAQETTRFAFDVGAGFTTPLGTTGNHLDTGWGVRAGAGINLNSHVGIMLNTNYDSLGINGTTLRDIGVPGGNVNIFSARIDPVFHVGTYRHADFYVTAGGGLYHRYQEFTQPATGTVLAYDPYFGTVPVAYSGNQVIASYSVNKPGVDGGIGVAFGSKWHGKFFAEARYNRIFMGNNHHTDYLPVSFGFRW